MSQGTLEEKWLKRIFTLSALGALDSASEASVPLTNAFVYHPSNLFLSVLLMACPHDLGYPSQETGPSQASPPCMGEGGHQDAQQSGSFRGKAGATSSSGCHHWI